jgi:RNA polymerase sigma factor (sigma-70 family)
MPTKGELVMAARAGDRQAFAALVELEAPVALRLAGSILHSESEAQDAVQDAFVRAWHDLPRLRDTDSWTPWFRTITVRSAIDRYRHTRRLREVDLDAHDPPTTADLSEATADRDRIRAAMQALSVDDRTILILRFAEDLEVPVIASTLGIRLGAAKVRLHRATIRLRVALGDRAGDSA